MELMQGDEQGCARLEAHEKRKKRRQGTTEAIGGPDQGPATEEEQPVFPDNPEERIELKRSLAERATSIRQEKRPKASQLSKRPGALTIGSGPHWLSQNRVRLKVKRDQLRQLLRHSVKRRLMVY